MAAWHFDPVTLREVVEDRAALERELAVAAPVDRMWLLRVLGRSRGAVVEGRRLLPIVEDPWRPLLLLAHAHHWLREWAEAARLQNQALGLAVGTAREATTCQHIGKRLLDEGRGPRPWSSWSSHCGSGRERGPIPHSSPRAGTRSAEPAPLSPPCADRSPSVVTPGRHLIRRAH